MLSLHDSALAKKEGEGSLKAKAQQVLSSDYGSFPVHEKSRFKSAFYESIEGGLLSRDRTKIYFVGIIDILTHYGARKKLEYNMKSLFQGGTVSCVPPQRYGDRFLKYMQERVFR